MLNERSIIPNSLFSFYRTLIIEAGQQISLTGAFLRKCGDAFTHIERVMIESDVSVMCMLHKRLVGG